MTDNWYTRRYLEGDSPPTEDPGDAQPQPEVEPEAGQDED